MAKAITTKKTKAAKSILTDESYAFLKNYINNPSPTGFESSGQKLWLEYIKPYTDTFFTDAYGTAVGVMYSNHIFCPLLSKPMGDGLLI